jgi:ParB family transcriptional regulator, chromosome partitioning protein
MPSKQSLGKGLGAIFPDLLGNPKEKSFLVSCGIEELSPNRFQPRKDFNDEELKNLVESIKKSGIIQPIVVRRVESGYEIITGERRWRAAQEAGLKNVPVVIKEASDIDLAEWSLIENLQRKDLNPIEEGEGYQRLIDQFSLSQENIALKMGKDRTTITNAIRLLKLPPEVKSAIIKNKITAGHARAILAVNNPKDQIIFFKTILKKNLSVRQSESLAKNAKKVDQNKLEKKHIEPVIRELEKRLTSKMMTSVKINKHNKKGNIVINFSSMEELDRIVTHIIKSFS